MVLIKLLGLLQPVELAAYDFLFYLNPWEKIDDRIVIVEYDEKSIQLLKEATISDKTLVFLLNKIIVQKPRIIGLDLYRDFPVPSDKEDAMGDVSSPISAVRVEQQANIEAYKSLSAIFASYPRIIGIEKIVNPKVPAPPILKKAGKVAASDLPSDSDFKIRRAYMFPTVDAGGNPTQIPYLGFALGYQYLAQDGWEANNVPGGLKISKQDNKIIMRPLKTVIGNLLDNDAGWDFLVPWRKTRNQKNFNRISVFELLENPIPSNLFRDRLVIIGNTTHYNGDIHQIPLNRWQKTDWTDGVEVVAHVASSIISAAIDQRKLIRPVPNLIEFLLLLFPVMGMIKIANHSIVQNQSIAVSRLRFITASYSLLVGLLLASISLIGFKLGWWISVTPAMFGIFWGWIVINNYYQSKRERENFNNLIFVIKDLDHNLYNISGHFGRSTRDITRCREAIIQEIENDLEINGISEVTVLETNFGPSLEQIFLCVKNLERETIRMDRYRKRASEFLKCVYSSQHSVAILANFNKIVKQTVKNLLTQHSYPYQIYIQEQYDNSIGDSKLYIEALEIIVESILDNAFFAVNPTLNDYEGYTPQIKVATVNARQFIQIIIEDNGSGIPKKYHSQIFLPRVSFKNDGGRGIGLYLVSQIIDYWKGSLSLESEIGRGSRFTISLPKLS